MILGLILILVGLAFISLAALRDIASCQQRNSPPLPEDYDDEPLDPDQWPLPTG